MNSESDDDYTSQAQNQQVEDGNSNEGDEPEKEEIKIENMTDLKKLKEIIKSKVGSPFCTNVLRIALNKNEGMIASTLVAFYSVQLDKKMLIRAIKTNQMDFLYCVWAFNKNYEQIESYYDDPDHDSEDSEFDPSEDEDNIDQREIKQKSCYHTYTFD